MDTKQELMEIALELFEEKGYDNTTIEDIHTKLGVSKGAFYHYFDSKEDMLEKIAVDFSEGLLTDIREITDNDKISARKKLEKIIVLVLQNKLTRRKRRDQIKIALQDRKNFKLKENIYFKLKERVLTPLEAVLEQGIEEGEMDIPNTGEMAGLILLNIRGLNYSLRELVLDADKSGELWRENVEEQIDEKIDFYEEMFTRMLNLQNDRVDLEKLKGI